MTQPASAPATQQTTITTCRSCGASRLEPVLSLGRTPLANALLTRGQLTEPETAYPLELVFCPACSLLQITETVPPEILFRNYFYFSSFSDALLRHAEALVDRLVTSHGLGPGSLAAEIASNDGYLLQFYQAQGIAVLGIEPATNIAQVATAKGIRTLNEFFGRDLAAQLAAAGERADVLHANNVMAHVADLNGFVTGIRTLLKDDGLASIEAPYARDTVEHVEFDQIYHEHLCYFSLTAVDHLMRRHGLRVVDVERLPIHGGTLRYFVAREEAVAAGTRLVTPAVGALLAEEAALGMDKLAYYRDFAGRVEKLKADLHALLRDLKAQGKTIAAYGASAKGATLLNYFGIAGETLDFVVDRSTVKQGHYTPGTHLEIVPPERLLEARPDYLLLLTWNFAEEILAQQAAYRESGGRFIIPLPQLSQV
jgi:SAM-dependent methyltransferase